MCISQVKEKDPGPLPYDWFLNSDKTECEIREAYESFEAILAHMSNLRERLGILFTDHSVILYGDPSPELIQTAKTRGVEVTLSPGSIRYTDTTLWNVAVDLFRRPLDHYVALVY